MRSQVLVRVATIGMIATLGTTAMGAEVAFVPVGATGAHGISENQIFVAQGAQVTLEIQLSDWGKPLLVAAQAGLDSSSLTSGFAGSVSPLIVPDPSAGAFIDGNHPNYVFQGMSTLEVVDVSTSNYRWGAVALDVDVPDPLASRYLGTLILEVSRNARGTFTVELLASETFLYDEFDNYISPLTLTPAQITIGSPCCLPNGNCEFLLRNACASAGGAPATNCLGDLSPSNGIDDACEADCDGDGVADVAENSPNEKDCDFDGVCNAVEIAGCTPGNTACDDCDGNRLPDECDLQDCNGNLIPDKCDIADMTSQDCGDNGIPDECENGACCFVQDGDQQCAKTSEGYCAAIGGVYRGPCAECPTQSAALISEPGGSIFVHIIGPPTQCPPPPPLASGRPAGCPTGAFFDPWVSPADGSMCHNFGAAGAGPIPADFFGPGSDPFGGVVCLKGMPLGPTVFGDFGDADTIIERSANPFDRCGLPAGQTETVDIEIVALSLVGIDPITVTFNGGQDPEPWDVKVDLSTVVTPPAGTLTATKGHCNGGTYTSVLNVQPRFTFDKVSDIDQVVLDTGAEGIQPVTLIQDVPAPWSHDPDPNLGLTTDPCSTFHAGLEEDGPTTECDCNGNSTRDRCDIEAGAADCNGNATPDACDISSGASPDVNGNGTPDECDSPFCDDGNCDLGSEDQCSCPSDCGAPPANETPSLTCTDGVDNDCDTLTDCDDPDCSTDTACAPFCGDGNCDLGDEDQCSCPSDCGAPPANETPSLTCTDGVDNDCDTLTDCDDPDCSTDTACAPFCGNGNCDSNEDRCNCPDDCGTPPSNEVPGATCADGNDNDCDGLSDCDDPDCASVCDVIPTVSAWGLIVMALLLLAGAKVYFRQRPATG